jgi:RNA polymerase sigma factor (sigma-70 family)
VGDASIEHNRFAAMFDELSPHVFAYVRRHVASATDAQDVVADTFLVAWRRWSDVPERALPWLLVVARNTIANRRRRERRHGWLIDKTELLERLAAPALGADHTVIERSIMLEALAGLSEAEREALLLVAWSPLTRAEAAAVAGCSQRAFEVRLSRARARLARALDDAPTPASTNTGEPR